MITKRETRLSQLMIVIQVVITILLFVSIEVFFPSPVLNLKEKAFIIAQIVLIWGFLFSKFRLGVIFRLITFVSMLRGYLVTISFGSVLFFTEFGLLPFMRHIPNSLKYLVLFAVLNLVVLIVFKVVFYYFMKFLRRKGYNSRHIILVADTMTIPFVDSFIKAKDWGYKITAIVSPDDDLIGKFENTFIFKHEDELKRFITSHPVDDIFYCMPIDDNRYNLEQIIKDSEEIGVSLHIMQEDYLDNMNTFSGQSLDFNNSFITHQTIPKKYLGLKIKDAIDLVFSVFILIVLLPFMLLISLLIKLCDGGTVFFKQERIGLNGRRFTCYKFRSMILNAESMISELQSLNESDGPTFKIENDPRITKIGRFLRKTSLDELPQFYNVLKGEMSVVGPRPPLLSEVKQYERSQLRRLSMKPGITCKWQVSGRNQVTFKQWMQMDLDYIDNWSLIGDLKIVIATVGVILKANGQ